jgi:hypothetical protein
MLNKLIVIFGSTIFGIALAAYLAIRFYRKKDPMYYIGEMKIVKDNISIYPGMEIRFLGKKVNNLTFARVIFWNNGREPILNKNLQTSNPLSLRISEKERILLIRSIFESSDANEFKFFLSKDSSDARIDFKYLNYKQGSVFEVAYEGEMNQNLIINGELIGVEKISRVTKSRVYLFLNFLFILFLIPFWFLFGPLVKISNIYSILFYLAISILYGVLLNLVIFPRFVKNYGYGEIPAELAKVAFSYNKEFIEPGPDKFGSNFMQW